MTVQELLEQLEGLPKDMNVLICTETIDGIFYQEIDYADFSVKDNDITIYGKQE